MAYTYDFSFEWTFRDNDGLKTTKTFSDLKKVDTASDFAEFCEGYKKVFSAVKKSVKDSRTLTGDFFVCMWRSDGEGNSCLWVTRNFDDYSEEDGTLYLSPSVGLEKSENWDLLLYADPIKSLKENHL